MILYLEYISSSTKQTSSFSGSLHTTELSTEVWNSISLHLTTLFIQYVCREQSLQLAAEDKREFVYED